MIISNLALESFWPVLIRPSCTIQLMSGASSVSIWSFLISVQSSSARIYRMASSRLGFTTMFWCERTEVLLNLYCPYVSIGDMFDAEFKKAPVECLSGDQVHKLPEVVKNRRRHGGRVILRHLCNQLEFTILMEWVLGRSFMMAFCFQKASCILLRYQQYYHRQLHWIDRKLQLGWFIHTQECPTESAEFSLSACNRNVATRQRSSVEDDSARILCCWSSWCRSSSNDQPISLWSPACRFGVGDSLQGFFPNGLSSHCLWIVPGSFSPATHTPSSLHSSKTVSPLNCFACIFRP